MSAKKMLFKARLLMAASSRASSGAREELDCCPEELKAELAHSAMMEAVLRGDDSLLSTYLEAGFDPESQGEDGWDLAMAAMRRGRSKCLVLLLDAGYALEKLEIRMSSWGALGAADRGDCEALIRSRRELAALSAATVEPEPSAGRSSRI